MKRSKCCCRFFFNVFLFIFAIMWKDPCHVIHLPVRWNVAWVIDSCFSVLLTAKIVMVPDPYGSYNMTGDQWTPPKTWGGGQGGLGVGWVGCAYFWILVKLFQLIVRYLKCNTPGQAATIPILCLDGHAYREWQLSQWKNVLGTHDL